ncbi:hypothetical protein Rhal01_02725 [Rubritalea halochordaticola]|uniref:Cytochrome c domain-containing protein n=1 Tax=Rubritalea halochordaticola TaxID=714537 RepID=A0ABP9V1H5_9BACT
MKISIILSLLLSLLPMSLTAGTLELTGKTAKIKGPSGGRQLTWNKDRFQYWSSQSSVPSWTFNAQGEGEVELTVYQSMHEIPSSAYTVQFGEHAIKATVQETASWTDYQAVKIGTFKFKKGINVLSIRPEKLKGRALMDLQKVSLSGDTDLLSELKPRLHKRVGIQSKLTKPHPSTKVVDLSPGHLNLKVTGIDFLSDGTMVVSSWDKWGAAYLIKGYGGAREQMQITRFAEGMAEPLGVVVVDDVIYVQQKQELTRLRDLDKDGKCDSYEVVCNAWEVCDNFHEFSFCPQYKDGYFYTTLAIAVNLGGATTKPQVKDRGTVVRIDPKTGQYEVVAAGFRTPNGMAFSADKEHLFVADNQGDYLPGNKIVDVKPGRFYNHRYFPPHPLSEQPVSPPMAWLPHNEIANSPTQPYQLKSGRYQGQLLVGDIHHGGIRRISMEEIDGELQGTAFRFTQGLKGGINRLMEGPDGHLYAGVCGSRGNWGRGAYQGLYRIEMGDAPVFEVLRVDTMSNGLTLTFTQPLKEGLGWDPAYYKIDTYTYKPTANYGGPKVDKHDLQVLSATVSSDRTQVFLEIPGIKTGYVVHGSLDAELTGEDGELAWAGEWWTTVNQVPTGKMGEKSPAPAYAKKIDLMEDGEEVSLHAKALTLFSENCVSCHKTTRERLIGPGLAGLLGKKQVVIRDGKRVEVTIDKAYLQKAIMQPGAEHPVGYQPIMSPLGDALGEKNVKLLVEWISTLK